MARLEDVERLDTRQNEDRVAVLRPDNTITYMPPIDVRDLITNPEYADWAYLCDDGKFRNAATRVVAVKNGRRVERVDPNAEPDDDGSDLVVVGSGEGGEGEGGGGGGGGGGGEDSPGVDMSAKGLAKRTRAELLEVAEAVGIEVPAKAKKADIVALLAIEE